MRSSILFVSVLLFAGCAETEQHFENTELKAASADAVFLDFEWKGQVQTDACYAHHTAIEQQVLYTIGQLNGHRSVGRIDRLQVENVDAVPNEASGGCDITYSAKMLVAWGNLTNIPYTFEFIFPRHTSWDGAESFTEKYKDKCVDWNAHDVDVNVFWYYYRPEKSACKFDDEDVYRIPATVTPSDAQTKGKYPEYDKVWEDKAFETVAIFGMAKEGGDHTDVGARGYHRFANKVLNALADDFVETEPTDLKAQLAGNGALPEHWVIRAERRDGRKVVVNGFMVDSIQSADEDFWQSYEALTPSADYIIYNGHSGLGSNIRKLAGKGVWKTGQYAIVFMNGCDTYAYLDSALADAHAAVNEDDPEGTKYLDIVANAMPSMFIDMPDATMAIFNGLMSYNAPMTYEAILDNISAYEVALVTGEHDNTYTP